MSVNPGRAYWLEHYAELSELKHCLENESDPEVRAAVAAGLVRFKQHSEVKGILEDLSVEESQVVKRAANAAIVEGSK